MEKALLGRCRPPADPEAEPDGTGRQVPDAARRMALEDLGRAFEEAERGRDWFGMKTELRRVEDAVQAVWYAARVRDDGR